MLCLQLALVLASADVAEADRLLHEGPDDRSTYQAALTLYEAALAGGGAGVPSMVDANKAQTLLRLGDVTKGDDDKLALYQKAQAAADAGIAKDAKCSWCWFWRGAALGRWGQTRGIMQSLFVLGDVKGAFEKALAIDPGNFDAALSLALIDQKVPGFAGGNIERAEKTMRAVIAAHPGFTRARLDLAELLEDDGRTDEARRLVQGVIDEKAPLHPGEYRKFDVARARKLLASLP